MSVCPVIPADLAPPDAGRPETLRLRLDPRTAERALSCVHCGLCLPACPTYVISGHEADSPRGRIQLIRGLSDGRIELSDSVQKHLDLCLDCRACETACPSNVVYHELIEETREKLRASASLPPGRLMQWIFFNVLVHPTRLKLALLPARLMQKIGIYDALRRSGLMKCLPAGLAKMERMLPASGKVWPRQLKFRLYAEPGPRAAPPKATVAFFAGCIGSVLFERVNRQTVELLAAAGADVLVFPEAGCCGAIHHHNGAVEPARRMARHNIDAMLQANRPVDFITATIAGCGAMLHEYDHLLRDDPAYAERAKEFSRRVKDISEVLATLGLPPMKHRVETTVTYHDACHLVHAQKVSATPRRLLGQIPGLTLVPLGESDMCCGAAGTYNLTQPEMSAQLAERKLGNIAATAARICVTGNAGCAMQIQSEAAARGIKLTVAHPVELLHAAVFGNSQR